MTDESKPTTNNAPDCEIFTVIETKGDKNRWVRIGAAWHKEDSDYIRGRLDALPVNGEIVLKINRGENGKNPAESTE